MIKYIKQIQGLWLKAVIVTLQLNLRLQKWLLITDI